MTAWDLYWILMLDNISAAIAALSIVSMVALAIAILAAGFTGIAPTSPAEKAVSKTLCRIIAISAPFVVLLVVAAVLTPTTKQAAVIYVLPRIATDENLDAIQAEAGDLYGLAKQWLKEQAGPDELNEDTHE